MKKILYLGFEDNYIKLIQETIESRDESLSLSVKYVKRLPSFFDIFKDLIRVSPDAIILDGEIFNEYLIELFKFVQTSNVLNIQHFFLVSSEQSKVKLSSKELAYGNYLHFYKSFEVKDIMYALESLLLEEFSEREEVVKAFYSAPFELSSPVRVYRLGRNSAQIETNIKFSKTIEVINFPFYKNVFFSHKHKILNSPLKREGNRFKYSYDLEYLYYSKPMKNFALKSNYMECEDALSSKSVKGDFFEKFQALEKKQKNILLVKTDNIVEEQVELEEDYVMAPTDLVTKRKAIFLNVMKDVGVNKLEACMNILAYDSTLELLKYEDFLLRDTKVNVSLRARSLDIESEITRERPEVIAIQCNDDNGLSLVEKILPQLLKVKNYFPYICLFNLSNARDIAKIRDDLQYHFIIASPTAIQPNFLLKVCEINRKKVYESELNKAKKRVDRLVKENPTLPFAMYPPAAEDLVEFYCDFSHELEEGTFFINSTVELISINEFEVIFKSKEVLSIGRVFKTVDPIEMHVVVVPHLKDTHESKIENCYRGVIHFLKETDKQAIRRYVNSIYTINNEEKGSLNAEEVIRLKKQYFSSGK